MALAFFDLDNTLVAGDTAQAFSEYIVESDAPTPEDFLQINHAYMDDYDNGTLDLAQYMRYTLAPLTQLSEADVNNLIQRFIEDVVADMTLDKAKALLERHKQEGDEVVIISATGTHLVAPIAKYLGVEHALGVDIEYRDGIITGEIVGTPTFREGKVTRAIQWANEHGYEMKETYFYSDSHNDLPLLENALYPIAVDPDPILTETAKQKGWEIISLR
ncbi:HAD family hydrolase [Marinomonas mediterranea]|jgi:HAD-superfamily subfamily IB hydrolase, TIGR01490|uniref:Histidinol-phosphatase n=1 Tax=Marinomonas mediterranea (strain ATCC 700492 / JCM 21426 / NBRC 103028 / MMB-1) TaxID=717774 RepID=F2JXY7_MARM1|nr:HAD family hydrolase [Marinomonas mediterranea]ADZ89636.1 HAD-superfamily subfamily IB hydrolase, TIGR01490 [Marinomonas mediterranea MMB-1]WCN07726.1 HAD-IB family hydrolase [Marinomonas mediterranea]WCN11827.1 HAD-IB family hydrolase [Marinomonas mediterranea]WCN15875.1 HAD-IB family hydrolase [Marinomonas mediterranea MMB-1]